MNWQSSSSAKELSHSGLNEIQTYATYLRSGTNLNKLNDWVPVFLGRSNVLESLFILFHIHGLDEVTYFLAGRLLHEYVTRQSRRCEINRCRTLLEPLVSLLLIPTVGRSSIQQFCRCLSAMLALSSIRTQTASDMPLIWADQGRFSSEIISALQILASSSTDGYEIVMIVIRDTPTELKTIRQCQPTKVTSVDIGLRDLLFQCVSICDTQCLTEPPNGTPSCSLAPNAACYTLITCLLDTLLRWISTHSISQHRDNEFNDEPDKFQPLSISIYDYCVPTKSLLSTSLRITQTLCFSLSRINNSNSQLYPHNEFNEAMVVFAAVGKLSDVHRALIYFNSDLSAIPSSQRESFFEPLATIATIYISHLEIWASLSSFAAVGSINSGDISNSRQRSAVSRDVLQPAFISAVELTASFVEKHASDDNLFKRARQMAVDCYTQIKEQASVIVVYDEKDIFARSLENLVMSAVAVPYPSAGSCMCDCLASLPIPVYASRAGAASVSQHNIIDSLPLLALAETLRQQCTLPANLPVLYWLSFLLERRGSVIHTSLGKEAGAEMSDQNTVDYEEYVQELYEFRYEASQLFVTMCTHWSGGENLVSACVQGVVSQIIACSGIDGSVEYAAAHGRIECYRQAEVYLFLYAALLEHSPDLMCGDEIDDDGDYDTSVENGAENSVLGSMESCVATSCEVISNGGSPVMYQSLPLPLSLSRWVDTVVEITHLLCQGTCQGAYQGSTFLMLDDILQTYPSLLHQLLRVWSVAPSALARAIDLNPNHVTAHGSIHNNIDGDVSIASAVNSGIKIIFVSMEHDYLRVFAVEALSVCTSLLKKCLIPIAGLVCDGLVECMSGPALVNAMKTDAVICERLHKCLCRTVLLIGTESADVYLLNILSQLSSDLYSAVTEYQHSTGPQSKKFEANIRFTLTRLNGVFNELSTGYKPIVAISTSVYLANFQQCWLELTKLLLSTLSFVSTTGSVDFGVFDDRCRNRLYRPSIPDLLSSILIIIIDLHLPQLSYGTINIDNSKQYPRKPVATVFEQCVSQLNALATAVILKSKQSKPYSILQPALCICKALIRCYGNTYAMPIPSNLNTELLILCYQLIDQIPQLLRHSNGNCTLQVTIDISEISYISEYLKLFRQIMTTEPALILHKLSMVSPDEAVPISAVINTILMKYLEITVLFWESEHDHYLLNRLFVSTFLSLFTSSFTDPSARVVFASIIHGCYRRMLDSLLCTLLSHPDLFQSRKMGECLVTLLSVTNMHQQSELEVQTISSVLVDLQNDPNSRLSLMMVRPISNSDSIHVDNVLWLQTLAQATNDYYKQRNMTRLKQSINRLVETILVNTQRRS